MFKGSKYLKAKFPKSYNSIKKIAVTVFRKKSHHDVFTSKYRNKEWGRDGSVSGPGSETDVTEKMRIELEKLLISISIKSLLDAGCGDFNWMREINLNGINYTGIDVVEELIIDNVKKYSAENIRFIFSDIANDVLPESDIIICRDVLVHYPLKEIKHCINNFKNSGAKYLLATTFKNTKLNEDIFIGGWRTLNMQIHPFNFPEPVYELAEMLDKSGKHFPDKYLAMWKLEDINA